MPVTPLMSLATTAICSAAQEQWIRLAAAPLITHLVDVASQFARHASTMASPLP
jgi:hypothetical protein